MTASTAPQPATHPLPALSVLITGGTGLIGTELTHALLAAGHRVSHLSRGNGSKEMGDLGVRTFKWDVDAGTIDKAALAGVDAIVHLAGASVAEGRWTDERKRELIDSRVKGTRLLSDALCNNPHNVKAIVCSSGSAYYGDTGMREMAETAIPGEGFLADLTVAWEKEHHRFERMGLRTVVLRTGVVLSRKGGALPILSGTVGWYVGAPLGSGQQVISWLHIDDMVALIAWALTTDRAKGTYNATAPDAATNEYFMRTLARVMHKPLLPLPVPKFALRLLKGEAADMVLQGQNMSSAKVEKAGFSFKYPQLKEALVDLMKG